MNALTDRSVKGIIVPLVTPLAEPDVLDRASLYALIDHVLAKRVDGIFILGTTGEGPAFGETLQHELIEAACHYTRGRTSVFVGIINTPLSRAMALADIAAENGADSLVVAAPFVPIAHNELLAYTKALAQHCAMPVCLYNRANQPEIAFTPELVEHLLPLESITSIKDSSGDMAHFKALLALKRLRPELSVFMGLEQFLAEAVGAGADGGVTGGANLFPGLYVDLYNAAVQRDAEKTRTLQQIVEKIVEHIYEPDYLAGLKYALSRKKLCRPVMANPGHAVTDAQKTRIEKFMDSFDESCF